MKQQAPKTLPQKAETIENTRKTADILIGAACQSLENLCFQGIFLFLSPTQTAYVLHEFLER
jgi:hypothetical protein